MNPLISSSGPSKHAIHPELMHPPIKPPISDKMLPSPLDAEQPVPPDTLSHAVSTALSENLTPTQLKTQSSTASIWSQGITGVFHFVDRGISKAMAGLCRGTENVLFIPSILRREHSDNLARLKEMTGNDSLGNFLLQYADHVAASIPEFFEQGGYANQILKGETGFLKQLMQSMVLKVGVNVGKRLKQEGKEVSLIAITSSVAALLAETTQSAQAAFAGEIEKPKARESALRNAALPVVDALLHLAFPKGASELPVRWGAHFLVWKQLRSELVQRVVPFQKLLHTVSKTDIHADNEAHKRFLTTKVEEAEERMQQEGHRFLTDRTLAESLAQKVCDQLDCGQGKDKTQLMHWLTGQIQQFGDSRDPSAIVLWKLLGKGTKAMLSYMLTHLIKNSEEDEDAVFSMAFHVLGQIDAFNQEHHKAIHACRKKLLEEGEVPEGHPEYQECFKPLAAMLEASSGLSILKPFLIGIAGESLVVPGDEAFLQSLALNYEAVLIPALNLYRAMDGEKESQETLLQPVEESLTAAKQRLHLQLTAVRDGAVICSAEEAVVVSDQIENLCGVLSQHITPMIQKKVFEDMRSQLGSLPDLLSAPKSVEIQSLYLQKVLQSSLMQILVNYLAIETQGQAVAKDVEGSKVSRVPLSQLLRKVAHTLEQHLHDDAEAIHAATGANLDPKAQQKALRKAFKPLAKDIMNLFVPWSEEMDSFPLDVPFKNVLQLFWKDIRGQAVPDLLASMYVDATLWKRAEAAGRDVMAAELKTPYLPEACRVLAGWIHDFVPTYVCSNQHEISEGIYSGIAKYLAQTGTAEGMSVSQYIRENEEAIKKRLFEDIFSCLAPDGRLVQATRPLSSAYMESFMLKLCSNMASKISDAQGRTPAQQEIFMMNLGLRVLQAFNQHFSKVNEITVAQRAYAAHLVPHEEFVEGFGDKLHPGVPQTVKGLAAGRRIKEALAVIDKERLLLHKQQDPAKQQLSKRKIKAAQASIRTAKMIQQEERRKFSEPLVKKLIQLSGFKGPEDLAVPADMRESLWEMFTTSLMPSFVESMFEEMARPEARIKLAISGLESLNKAMDSIKPDDEPQLVFDDAIQRKLNQACGELVLQLVQFVPQSMVKAAFKIDKFKILEKQSAELVGKSVRNYLGRDLNLFVLMDQGAQSALETLYPGGKWQPDARGMLRFTPPVNSHAKPADFSQFSDEALEKLEREKLLQSERELQQVRKMMVKTTRRLASQSVSGLAFPLLKLKQMWDACVEKIIPERFLQFCRTIGKHMIFQWLEAFLAAITYPFREAYWFFAEIYIGRKVDPVIKSLQLEIHENLLYQLSDVLMNSLTEEKSFADMEAELIEPLVVAAERRGWRERLQLIGDIKRFGLRIAGFEEAIE